MVAPRKETHASGSHTHLSEIRVCRVICCRVLWLGFIGLLLFMVGDGVESGYIAPYLAQHGAGTETRAAIIISAYGLAVTLGSWLSGALSDVWGPRRVMVIGLVIWVTLQVVFLSVALPTRTSR